MNNNNSFSENINIKPVEKQDILEEKNDKNPEENKSSKNIDNKEKDPNKNILTSLPLKLEINDKSPFETVFINKSNIKKKFFLRNINR